MGHTLRNLSTNKVDSKTVFNNRFVVEICECVHVHYRNLRIALSLKDFLSIAQGMSDALIRWQKQLRPQPSEDIHIELCRKEVATIPVAKDEIKVNLNSNLYNRNEGRIFSEGADFKDPAYIHLKIRDLRLELSIEEFNKLADSILEAKKLLSPREVAVE